MKIADDLSLKAQETCQLTLVIESNALRSAAKYKTFKPKERGDRLD